MRGTTGRPQKGFYRQRGLNVEIVPGGPRPSTVADLHNGKAEFATAFFSGALRADASGPPSSTRARLLIAST